MAKSLWLVFGTLATDTDAASPTTTALPGGNDFFAFPECPKFPIDYKTLPAFSFRLFAIEKVVSHSKRMWLERLHWESLAATKMGRSCFVAKMAVGYS